MIAGHGGKVITEHVEEIKSVFNFFNLSHLFLIGDVYDVIVLEKNKARLELLSILFGPKKIILGSPIISRIQN